MALITGWGRSTWNSGTWNSPVPVEVTGVSAASAIGSETLEKNSIFSQTGVSAASAIGSIQVNFAFSVEGVSAQGLVNNAMVWSRIDPSQTPSWAAIDASQTPSWTKIAA